METVGEVDKIQYLSLQTNKPEKIYYFVKEFFVLIKNRIRALKIID